MYRWLSVAALVGVIGCGEQAPDPGAPALKTDHGVDAAAKVIRIGTLNDESGPGAAIGKPFALGKRVLAGQINAGASGLLPDGWKVELVERDHGYNAQSAVAAYNEIHDDVLFVGTSFGTPNTLPLRPMLEQDGMFAFPASLSSEMANHPHTPPIGPSYEIEARRAMEFAVHLAGGAPAVKAGIVYQQDDYGKDGLAGWKAAAESAGVAIVSEQTVAPGQKDMAAVIAGLKDAGATHVLLTTLPSATGPILGTAAQLQYAPVWIGNTPAWIDRFFDPTVIPSAVFANYHQMLGVPTPGEDVPGMDAFTAAFAAHGGGGSPDQYTLASYVQGLAQIEAAKLAIERGDITRVGYRSALHTLSSFDGHGMFQPIDLSRVPYAVSDKTRVLKPNFESKGWTVVSDYASPGSPFAAPAAPEKAEGE
ncbi:MAG: ABC transporter substrate-binding protein [Myxococcota bacterium]